MISVVVVSDLRLLREALCAVLSVEVDFEVHDVPATAEHLVPLLHRAQPRVTVVDLDGPGGVGLPTARLVVETMPTTAVVVLTASRTPEILRQALAAGITGYATRDLPPAELVDLIRRVAKGERMIDTSTALAALATMDNPLTTREQEVLRLSLLGLSTTDIAQQVHLTAGTVRNYLSDAVRKLGCANRLQAANRARESGWL
ncbi:response regulator transcription factor [Actinoplanes sp. N902-109]|uniref:response regulator transcription factor n=1 Tax=Actinoplanes sp. (strain N902-109) TaxID=649831 RepID=UPI00032938B6|nr:response regulator transcription factor [Actinoplanes sp. N902-109]AGL17153.1 DNA-binding response regulator [Actinoplanes sp. N902-109]